MEITKEEAAKIAWTHLKASPKWTNARISEVCHLGELQSRPPAPYGVSKEALEGAWIVYLEQTPLMIQSSNIVLVAKADGRVLFVGSANDEG